MSGYGVTFASYQIGADAYEAVGRICRPYGSRVLLIGGKTAMEKGLPHLEKALAGSGLEIVETAIYGHECTYAQMEQLTARCKALEADMIFGMGGGKALDTAKGTAFACRLPVFTFPTIAATCAATTALSVVYKEDGTLDEIAYYDVPAVCAFIHTGIIAQAPDKFLRAGMGDTLGKHYECYLASRGDVLDHSSALARQISNMCRDPLLEYGVQAMRDSREGVVSQALQEMVLAVIVSTGLVSLLVNDDYNCAVAHSVCYGLAVLPGFEETHLHGDTVAYGVLVQLAIDGQLEELTRLRQFLQEIGIAVSLKEMGVAFDRAVLVPVLAETVAGPDMVHLPYQISEEMLFEGMRLVEEVKI